MSGERHERVVELQGDLLVLVFQQALAAFPQECCGWLSGPRHQNIATRLRPCANSQGRGGHPTASDRSAETAYVIAGADLLALARALDDDDPPKVIYHSHPNGRAYFSETDQEVAASPFGDGPAYPVQQLVIGVTESEVTEAAMFAWAPDLGRFEELHRYDVTPHS